MTHAAAASTGPATGWSVAPAPNRHWTAYPMPAVRREAHYGGRIIRSYAERAPSFWSMLADSAARHPQREALVAGGRRWTYAALLADVERAAGAFAARGLSAGDRVALFLGNRPEFVIALFALQRLGAITVPIGIREQQPGLAYMLGQCGASAVLFDAPLADRVPDAAEVASLRLRVSVGGTADDATTWEDLVAGPSQPRPPHVPHEDDCATILYTSGTTGRPKGAMLTHFSIAHSVLHFVVTMKLDAHDRSVLTVPASHVTGLVAIIACMVAVGGALIVMSEFKAGEFLALAAAERATHTILVPAMYNLCLLQPDFERLELSAWRIAGFGGAPMPTATIERLARTLPGLVLVNAYGATETTSPTTVMPLGENTSHADTVGVPAPLADVIVVDDEGRELPPGTPGELWIGGPMVVPGYWDNPGATAAEFTAGYWHSGDIGSIDAEGHVRVFDRKKDMLNRGGFKIYSVEVENVLMAFPGVVEAAVVGKPCPVLGERVHAFVHAGNASIDAEAVRAHCAQRLADYKVPETVTVATAPLPRNANGKLLKRTLREQLPG